MPFKTCNFSSISRHRKVIRKTPFRVWPGFVYGKAEDFITARKRSLRRLCFYRCLSVHRGGGVWFYSGGHVWFYLGGMHGFIRWGHAWFYSGGVCGFIWGMCMVLFRGHAWFYSGGHAWFYLGGMHGFIRGACMVLFGGHAWFYLGGMCGFIWGGMCGFFSFFGYNEIRSMSGRYASYWNAFLFSSII